MWTRDEWTNFRTERLPRWLQIFEVSFKRSHFGGEKVGFADIAVYALFGNMLRCLPDLGEELRAYAPGVDVWCKRIASKPSLASYVEKQQAKYGDRYCGGQIEQSIRNMLATDRSEKNNSNASE